MVRGSQLPFAAVFGLAFEPMRFFNIDVVHSLVFALRGGCSTNDDERGWAGGVSVKYAIAGIPWRIDYAYEPFGVLGTRHVISLGVGH